MSIATQTRELLVALAQSIINADLRDDLMKRDNLRELRSSLEDAVKSVIAAQDELSPISKLRPDTLITVSEFVAEPETREWMFEVVKMSHVCRDWRSTLISCPRLWTSIFVKNDHRDFVAACLERSRELPLTVCLDLKYGDYQRYPNCTYIPNMWWSRSRVNENNPCNYHTTIYPLLATEHTQRIRKLDVRLAMLYHAAGKEPDEEFKHVLEYFKFFGSPLPSLESLSFSVVSRLSYPNLPRDLFGWVTSPPTRLRHLALHGCYGGLIRTVRNLTSFELAGTEGAHDCIELDEQTFLSFISGSPSLVSLKLSDCYFPDRLQLSQVTPVKLPELKTLRLADSYELAGFLGLIEVPALKTLSSLRVSIPERDASLGGHHDSPGFQAYAESDDGFQLYFDTKSYDELAWAHSADHSPAFIRLEGQGLVSAEGVLEVEASLLSLFMNVEVLEIGASFVGLWYPNFWNDLDKIGSQLTTLRLEVIEGMDPEAANSVKRFVKARFERGMPPVKLERMMFEGTSEEDGTKARELWEEFRAGLDVDQCPPVK